MAKRNDWKEEKERREGGERRPVIAGEPGYDVFVRHLSTDADITGAQSERGQRVAAGRSRTQRDTELQRSAEERRGGGSAAVSEERLLR